MGPKKPNKASKKNVEKKKDQKVDDKTFGLKNKNKSKVVQQYVAQVKCGINGGPQQVRTHYMTELRSLIFYVVAKR